MKRYEIFFVLDNVTISWEARKAEKGLRNEPIRTKRPMTQEEAWIFNDMENKGTCKNIEPGRIFFIDLKRR